MDEHYILIQNQMLVVNEHGDWFHTTFEPLGLSPIAEADMLNVHLDDQQVYRVAEVNEKIDEQRLRDYRHLMDQVSPEEAVLISRALQLLTWKKQHQYCGQCGRRNFQHTTEQALVCKDCHLVCYPRISPCIMCLITRGDECLLAHHKRHSDGMYSTLAGFVEAGENLEQTVHREVFEEVGVAIKNLRYFHSQSWPFPHQLMVGYFAEYETGDISLGEEEIIDAQWFHYDNLPITPPASTLSGKLISEFVRDNK